MNMTEYSRHWYAARETQWQSNTQHGYLNLIENHIIPRMSQIPLSELTEKDIQDFYDQLSEDGLSDRSIWCVHLLLRRILGEACREGLLEVNPASNIQMEPSERRTLAPLPTRQLRQYLAAAGEVGTYPIFYIGLARGLQQGELITLPWAAFDIEHPRLILPRRWVKLTEPMEEIIRQEQKRHPDSITIFRDARTGQPYTQARLYYLHQQILTTARLPKMGFRELQMRVKEELLCRSSDKTITAILIKTSDRFCHIVPLSLWILSNPPFTMYNGFSILNVRLLQKFKESSDLHPKFAME